MSNAFTLADLNRHLETKYKPFEFTHGREKFTLNQVLRLPKEARAVVKAQLEALEEHKNTLTEDEMLAILKAIVSNVMVEDKTDRLFDLLENDLVKVTILFEKWVESTQAGEA